MNKFIYYGAMILGIMFFMMGWYLLIHYRLIQESKKYVSLYYHKMKKRRNHK